MKKLFFLLILCLPLSVYSQQDTSGIKWIETEWDFKQIPFGIPASHTYKFVNNSNGKVSIISVEASCGCTQPTWTQGVINPGDTGTVEATYRANTEGTFRRQITIYTTRSPLPTNLILFGEVIRKD
jgi:hypothetical protein